MPASFIPLQIPDVVLIQPRLFKDNRGFFRETFKASEFSAAGLPAAFVQGNHSHSTHGVVRALHYQKNPQAQGKLLAVTHGEIFDVAVDIRIGSPTYGRWVAEVLSAENGHMLYIPEGFAHGFCVLSDAADLNYQATREYAPQLETGIRWDDPTIGIDWPVANPILSTRDLALPTLQEADNNFVFVGQALEIGD
jgi:dTDP-4-dehydrorhamnose 3,5-epimerase